MWSAMVSPVADEPQRSMRVVIGALTRLERCGWPCALHRDLAGLPNALLTCAKDEDCPESQQCDDATRVSTFPSP